VTTRAAANISKSLCGTAAHRSIHVRRGCGYRAAAQSAAARDGGASTSVRLAGPMLSACLSAASAAWPKRKYLPVAGGAARERKQKRQKKARPEAGEVSVTAVTDEERLVTACASARARVWRSQQCGERWRNGVSLSWRTAQIWRGAHSGMLARRTCAAPSRSNIFARHGSRRRATCGRQHLLRLPHHLSLTGDRPLWLKRLSRGAWHLRQAMQHHNNISFLALA